MDKENKVSLCYGCHPSSPLPLQIGIQSRTPNLISEKPYRYVNSMKHHGTNGREVDFGEDPQLTEEKERQSSLAQGLFFFFFFLKGSRGLVRTAQQMS